MTTQPDATDYEAADIILSWFASDPPPRRETIAHIIMAHRTPSADLDALRAERDAARQEQDTCESNARLLRESISRLIDDANAAHENMHKEHVRLTDALNDTLVNLNTACADAERLTEAILPLIYIFQMIDDGQIVDWGDVGARVYRHRNKIEAVIAAHRAQVHPELAEG